MGWPIILSTVPPILGQASVDGEAESQKYVNSWNEFTEQFGILRNNFTKVFLVFLWFTNCHETQLPKYPSCRQKAHLLSHAGERPFMCEQCDYSSKQKSNLKTRI